jgi:hypothetical protein
MWDQKEPGSNYWPGMCTARKNALPMEQGTKNFNGLLHSSEGKKKKNHLFFMEEVLEEIS